MKVFILAGVLVLTAFTIAVQAQNSGNLYYLIKKKDIDNDKFKIIYKAPDGLIQPIRICYEKLKAEGLSLQDGIAVFHFEKINSSFYDTIPDCISNNTPLGQFEIDIAKRKIGDKNTVAKLPFRAWSWNITLIPYRVRFAQNSYPVYAEASADALAVSAMYGYTVGYAKINHESITHYHTTFGPFVGLTSADLNIETVTIPSKLTRDQSNVAITYGLSAIFGRDNFGISLSLGFDMSIGKNSDIWIYQNKPWFGIGISSGLGIF